MNRVNVVFPVETVVRELDSRLLMSALHATPRHRFFMGQPGATYRVLRHIEGGAIYIGKDILSPSAAEPLQYFRGKKRGLKLVHIDEEGGAFPGQEDTWKRYLLWRCDPSVIETDDILCTWGDFQTEYYRSVPGATCEVRTTGHPRFDLCRPRFRAYYADDAAALRAKYKDFVVVNTNFVLTFNPIGHRHTFSPAQGYDPTDDVKRMTLISTWARNCRTAAATVRLVHQLSISRREVNFVIRPHPAEDQTFYEAAFNGVPNVHIVREGSVNAWMAAARAVIHSGSTSGLEAHLLERPVVYYDGGSQGDIDLYLTGVVGRRVQTHEEALETVLAILESKAEDWVTRQVPERARKLFRNFDDDASFAVLDAVRAAEEKPVRHNVGRSDLALELDEVRARAVEEAKHAVRPMFPARYRSAKTLRTYFPGFRADDISARLARMHRITGKKLQFKLHGKYLLEVWGG